MYKYLLISTLLLFLNFKNTVIAVVHGNKPTSEKTSTAQYRNKTTSETKGFNEKLEWIYKDSKKGTYSILSAIYQILSISISINEDGAVYVDEEYSSDKDNEIISNFIINLKIPNEYTEKIKIKREMKKHGDHITADKLVEELKEWYELLSKVDTKTLSKKEYDCLIEFINPKNKTLKANIIELIQSYDIKRPFSTEDLKTLFEIIESKKTTLDFNIESRTDAYKKLTDKEHTPTKDNEQRPNKKRKKIQKDKEKCSDASSYASSEYSFISHESSDIPTKKGKNKK